VIVLEIRTSSLQRLYHDWEIRRRGREFPARSDFDVLDLKYVIGQIALVEVSHDPLRFRFRLHGTGIARRVGYDMTGKAVDALPNGRIRALVLRNFAAVVAERAPRVEIRARHIMDDRTVDSEVLAMPLARDGKTIDMLLVAVAFL
jgi:hypothetical protein